MKLVAPLMILSLFFSMKTVSAAALCSDPLKGELCYNMVYLRTQMLALGEQRELMQINYPYLSSIGKEILDITDYLFKSSLLNTTHIEGLQSVLGRSDTMITLAKAKDPLAIATANSLQLTCLNCHKQTDPSPSGLGWEKIFKNDWEHINKNCSREGRTPYLCRSMNGMMSAYAGIFAQNQLGRKSSEALRQSALEIERIAADLIEKKLIHGADSNLADVQSRAQEVIQLTSSDLDEAFRQGLLITQSCMNCHATMRVRQPWNTAMKNGP